MAFYGANFIGRGKSVLLSFPRVDPYLLADAYEFSDALDFPLLGVSIEDTAAWVDSVDGVGSIVGEPLYNTVQWEELLSANLIVSTLADVSIWTDEIGYGAVITLSDTAAWGDVLDIASIVANSITDTASFSDLLSAYSDVEVLSNTASWQDALTGVATLSAGLVDAASWVDNLIFDSYKLAVINADTGAVSEYTITPEVSGLCQFSGIFYIASSDGLYALDADADYDNDVVWAMNTGLLNFGTDLMKRVIDVNMLGSAEGATILAVTTTRGGTKVESRYQLEDLTRTAPRDGVVKVGRGLQSVYWAVGAQGVGPAEIDEIRVNTVPLSRRRY